jgi:hypothetical protein
MYTTQPLPQDMWGTIELNPHYGHKHVTSPTPAGSLHITLKRAGLSSEHVDSEGTANEMKS